MDFFSVGVIVKGDNERGKSQWIGTCNFQSKEYFGDKDNMKGSISTVYYNTSLSDTLDNIEKLLKQFNISIGIKDLVFAIYLYPKDSKEKYSEREIQLVTQEAEKRNWDIFIEE